MVQEEKKWWYAADNQKFGPYTASEFKALAISGKIIAAHLVWKQGFTKWVPASSIKGFIPQNTPPPLPTDNGCPSDSSKVIEDRGHANVEQIGRQQAERNEEKFASSESWAWNDSRWYLDVIQHYAVFNGRTGRKAYWMFVLYNFIVAFTISSVGHFLDVSLGGGSKLSEGLYIFYNLGVFLPATALAVRRMHDIGRSGWWILFPVVNVVFFCMKGHAGENKYGPDPKVIGSNQINIKAVNTRSSTTYIESSECRKVFSTDIPISWQTKFKLIEKAGGTALKDLQALSFTERGMVVFNVFGFLFGPLYYLVKGMWKKAIVLTLIGILLIVVSCMLFQIIGFENTNATNMIIPIIIATRANIDYYKKIILGDNGWW